MQHGLETATYNVLQVKYRRIDAQQLQKKNNKQTKNKQVNKNEIQGWVN